MSISGSPQFGHQGSAALPIRCSTSLVSGGSLDLVLTGRHVRELVSGTGAAGCLPSSRPGLPDWRQIGQPSGPAGWWPVTRCPRPWLARASAASFPSDSGVARHP